MLQDMPRLALRASILSCVQLLAVLAAAEPPAALRELDAIFAGLPAWLAGLYDRERGGFLHSPACRGRADAPADIQSTAQALGCLDELGLVDRLPPARRAALAAYFATRQRPDGIFDDPAYPQMADPRLSGRAQGYARGALRRQPGQDQFATVIVDEIAASLAHDES